MSSIIIQTHINNSEGLSCWFAFDANETTVCCVNPSFKSNDYHRVWLQCVIAVAATPVATPFPSRVRTRTHSSLRLLARCVAHRTEIIIATLSRPEMKCHVKVIASRSHWHVPRCALKCPSSFTLSRRVRGMTSAVLSHVMRVCVLEIYVPSAHKGVACTHARPTYHDIFMNHSYLLARALSLSPSVRYSCVKRAASYCAVEN